MTKAEREVAIHRALDRIRKVALAMNTTDDIGPVVGETRDVLVGLGIRPFRTLFALYDRSSDIARSWSAKKSQAFGHNTDLSLSTLREAGSQSLAPRQKGKRWVVTRFNRRQLTSEFRKFGEAFQSDRPAGWVHRMVSESPIPYFSYEFYFTGGSIGLGMDRELDKDEIAVARRVAEAFDFAHKRLVDLQDKERRAHEAEIEAALERVRSRALGMQESSDLQNVVSALTEEVRGLGIPAAACSIMLIDPKAGEVRWSVQTPGTMYPWQTMALDEMRKNPPNDKAIDAFLRGDDHFHAELDAKGGRKHVKGWVDRLVKFHPETKGTPIPRQPKGARIYTVNFEHGWIWLHLGHIEGEAGKAGYGVIKADPLPDDELRTMRRFADVFEYAYGRFRELELKEAQNRELSVEAALERARGAALAMKTSDDLEEAAVAMFQELQGLSLPVLRCGLAIEDSEEDPRAIELWGRDSEGSVSRGVHFPLDEHPVMVRVSKAWMDGEDFYLIELEGEPMEDWLRYMRDDLGYPMEWPGHLDVYRNYCVFFPHGLLYVVAPDRLVDKDLNVVRRFRDGFAFAYSRYLELAEKERQNRALLVEGALERVRSRSLAMEGTEELEEISRSIYGELTDLELDIWSLTVVIHEHERNLARFWATSLDSGLEYDIPLSSMESNPTATDVRRARERGDASHKVVLDRQALRDLEKWARLNSQAVQSPFDFPDGVDYILTHVFFDLGNLHVFTKHDLSEGEIGILKRFADAFGHAYRRHIELDQKIRQNRELTIQNALERVRSRALGMQESEELADVSRILFDEFNDLGISTFRTGINTVDEENDRVEMWPTRQGQSRQYSASLTKWYELIPETADVTAPWGVRRFEGEQIPEWNARIAQLLDLPDERLDELNRTCPDPAFSYRIPFSRSRLSITLDRELSEEELATARRFAGVFDFAYTRFLELKQKEDQNRELTIQNALERVRAQALSMQASEDLLSVANVLGEQIAIVGIQSIVTSIEVVDRENGRFRSAAMLESLEMADWEEITMESFQTVRVHNHMLEAFDRGDGVFVTRLEGEECREHQQFWIEKLFESNPEARDIGYPDQSSVMFTLVFFSRGWIFLELGSTVGEMGQPGFQLIEGDPLSEEDLEVVKRFAEMFDFAYSRFLELKEKEDQNRELTIQNALERVRSRALGMQESDELEDVTKVLFDEYEALEFPVRSLTLRIDEANTDTTEISFVRPGLGIQSRLRFSGSLHDSFDLPFVRGANEAEDKSELFTYEWSEEEYEDYRRLIVEDLGIPRENFGSFADRESPFGEGIISHSIFHRYGNLIVWATDLLPDEDIQVAKRFVDVFEFAYGRFLELEEKEDQNRELMIQNALERVRSRALGMQESTEIDDVSRLLKTELTDLDLQIKNSTLVIIEEASDRVQISMQRDNIALLAGSDVSFTEFLAVGQWDVEAWRAGRTQTCIRELGSSAFYAYRDWWIETVRRENPGYSYDGLDEMRLCEHVVPFSNGAVMLLGPEVLSDENLAVVKRLADVFDFAYGRFLELKQKEDQNRELTVQNALERVRSRAQGMQESADIDSVSSVMYDEIRSLGIPIIAFGIFIVNQDENAMLVSTQVGGGGTTHWHTVSVSVIRSLPGMAEVLNGRERGDAAHSVHLENDEAIAWLDGMYGLIGEAIDASDEEIGRLPNRPYLTYSCVFFSRGYLHLTMGRPSGEWGDPDLEILDADPLSDSEIQIVKRFADVFDFAYGRYLELKEAEQAAREAGRRAAVDRLRAEATAMGGTDDLANVVSALWEGLKVQDVRFNFLTMEIAEPERNLLQSYAALPDDDPFRDVLSADVLSNVRSRRTIRKDVAEGVDLLRGEMPLSEALEVGFTTDYFSSSKVDRAQRSPQYLQRMWGFRLPEGAREINALRVGFGYGGISVDAPPDEEFTDDTIQLVESLAGAVSLGIARFFDFRRLEEQNRALEEANAQIQEANRAKSTFLANTSHELRTPMNAIIGFTRLVLRRGKDELSDRNTENLEKVRASADHLLNLINEVLDLSKIEAGRLDIQPAPFDVPALLRACCSTITPMVKDGVALDCNIADGMGDADTDEARLRQIVINLLSNAAKFTEQGAITVDATQDSGALVVSVTDTGIGIPEESLGTIFEEFRQVDGSLTRKHQGTGLGLSITKKFAELLGGTIGVESREGVGSTFAVKVPVRYGE